MAQLNKAEFDKNPAQFLENAIKEYVATSPQNQLPAFNNEPVFDTPLVGFADGDDPIFQYYKMVVGDYHLTPREAWALHLQNVGGSKQPDNLSVISFIMPITQATRRSLAAESVVPSLRWNHTRWQGEDLIHELSNYLVSLLKEMGYRAVAPDLAKFYEVKTTADGERVSNWSQRHIAYAAGLGTFSLSDALITPRGSAMRCGSVITDAVLTPSPRIYQHHLANCLSYRGESCARCIERCPAGAISQQGHDRKRCREYTLGRQPALLKELGREEDYIGRYHGCGLCQTKVPCEAGIPRPDSLK